MTNDDNLIPLLKNHIGAKIYDKVRGESVIVDSVKEAAIYCRSDNTNTLYMYEKDGKLLGYPRGMVALVLSKEFEDISVLEWKKGDILVSYPYEEDQNSICIFKHFINNTYTQFKCVYETSYKDGNVAMTNNSILNSRDYTSQNNLINIRSIFSERIHNVLNVEFNFVKNRPCWEDLKFNYGDYIIVEQKQDNPNICRYDSNDNNFLFTYDGANIKGEHFYQSAIYDLDDIVCIRDANDEEIKILKSAISEVDSIIRENEENTDLKPFDKVLVRDRNDCRWNIGLFSFYKINKPYTYKCINGSYIQCIPYKGNEHLLGTTNNPDETQSNN